MIRPNIRNKQSGTFIDNILSNHLAELELGMHEMQMIGISRHL